MESTTQWLEKALSLPFHSLSFDEKSDHTKSAAFNFYFYGCLYESASFRALPLLLAML